MHCPFCPNEETQVLDSRVSEDGRAVRRRRRCEKCDKRFTTYERIELSMPTLVKKDGSRVDYSRDKILGSMRLALRKRPVSSEALEAAIAQLEEKVISLGEKEIPTSRIGELVMRELKKLDKVAYIRYASVYRSFEDIESFESALKELR
ncbi:transcriptional regulator NrdR [Polynucleobacter kasalickyi]|uniref:Transcriptional repressor NrdR n=1 Tax=Polynucleobacter kasalickyi TaxID=1938817 RepID=A0A1W1Y1U9_9BURK|nr:transcriptional regulator NrdR [Polynucleobacter kasalickyi]SMC30126.1 transcriptional repressor NrdR [Polynucleobacter kasalickyi]